MLDTRRSQNELRREKKALERKISDALVRIGQCKAEIKEREEDLEVKGIASDVREGFKSQIRDNKAEIATLEAEVTKARARLDQVKRML